MLTLTKFFSIIEVVKEEICIIKLDYTIDSPEERLKLVNQILKETPDPSEQYLEILSDYLVLCLEKQEKKEKKILTDNRLATITKHETSYEGLAEKLECGEDGVYNLMAENSHNIILTPKIKITPLDLAEIPLLKQLSDSIARWEQYQKTATGRAAFIIKRTLIEMRRDQYLIKNAYKPPIVFTKLTRGSPNYIPLDFEEWIEYDEQHNAVLKYKGVSFCDYKVVSELLSYFPILKSKSQGNFLSDTWYVCQDFENLMRDALADYPLYRRIVEYKMDRFQNIEIKNLLEQEFQFTHSVEYISSLWRNKIPKLIAQKAQDQYLTWYFTYQEYGKWKRCSRCGQVKLAHTRFFSINRTAKDGFYSICKKCRNKKVNDYGWNRND